MDRKRNFVERNFKRELFLICSSPRAFVDHAKVHDPTLPSHIPRKSTPPLYNSISRANVVTPKIVQPVIVSRPVSGTSTSQLRSIISKFFFRITFSS